MTVYVLILYAWTLSAHAGGGLGTAEFTSKDRCEAAAVEAKKKFDGFYSSMYYVCVPK